MSGAGEDREAFAAFLLRMRTKGISTRELIAAFEASGKGRKNRYFMIDVADAAQLPDLYRILRFKRECR